MHRPIVRFTNGAAPSGTEQLDDEVASEYALTIYVNDRELATVVCTPEYMEDLVIGFLASEGVIRSIDQVESLTLSRLRGTARVKTKHAVNFNQDYYNKRYIASCCGKSRQTFYFTNDAHTAKYVDDDVQIHPDDVFRLMNQMEASADLFRQTGGVHMAALCDTRQVLLGRTDIGRHNALDKLFGHALRTRVDLHGKLITFSGRLSSEVLLKVSKIGVGIVLAKSAPTALAIEMADELGITAVGFVRGKSFNVYTHPWRIVGAQPSASQ
ncbi:formate dehydrogenase accessory sulfurtransferase FdhD [Alicyclobacillus cycloheptanicus]|nr:formate dehydrogenase accessory sulfurtransferase FdhD [Alicyclobacillus cycloheptanicus]WDM02807.1 formate dehydrogenase accessory sulfurtransferase FdhD [Alicyclobacillus cycloheptanicus]